MAETDFPYLRTYPATLHLLEHQRICEEQARIAALNSRLVDPLDMEIERLQKIQAIERMRRLEYWEQYEIEEQMRAERLNHHMRSLTFAAGLEREHAIREQERLSRSRSPYPDSLEASNESDRELVRRYARGDKTEEYKGELEEQYRRYREGLGNQYREYKDELSRSRNERPIRNHTQESKSTQTRHQQHEAGRKKEPRGGAGVTDYTPVKRINNKQHTEESRLPKEDTPLKQPTFQNIVTPARSSRAGRSQQQPLKEDNELSRTQPHTAHKWLKNSANRSTNKLQKHSRLDRSSYINRSRQKKPEAVGTKETAMQLIRNRMKVSEVVYRDSQMRTVKHELDHLFNTYQNEVHGREEVKGKINSHPQILRHHDFVVPNN